MEVIRGGYRRKLKWTVVFLLCVCGAKAQEVPSESLKEIFKNGTAQFYSFNYPSKGTGGEDVVLSSLLVAWAPSNETDSIEALHIYSHYTITANKECPTLDLGLQNIFLFGAIVTTSHSVVIAPDFEGYGVSKDRSHPYLSEELTAQQMVDGVQYGMMLYQKLVGENKAPAFRSDWRSYGYGFSQGGAVALAVHRHIEQNDLSDELRFHGSICGDGPYDLLATLQYYINDDGTSYGATTSHRKGMCTMPMVLPMIIKGMLDSHPDMQTHTIEDYLSQQFLDTGIMDWLASKQYSTGDISKKWYKQLKNGLTANGRHYSPQQMAELFYSPSSNDVWAKLDKVFTPDFLAYIATDDPDAVPAYLDIRRAMTDNSLCEGWTPQHRIQFVHAKGDMVVPYGNYLAFRDAHSEDEGNLFRVDDSPTSTDHTSVGTSFFLALAGGSYNKHFQWMDETATSLKPAYDLAIRHLDDAWYDLEGRRLSGRPTSKGIYVFKGKKIVIK